VKRGLVRGRHTLSPTTTLRCSLHPHSHTHPLTPSVIQITAFQDLRAREGMDQGPAEARARTQRGSGREKASVCVWRCEREREGQGGTYEMPLLLQSQLADSTKSLTDSRIFLRREPWTSRASNICRGGPRVSVLLSCQYDRWCRKGDVVSEQIWQGGRAVGNGAMPLGARG
jgi:hypothetical protein